jgi:CelD/BcsL family acetyltransferase involved in cellulose biosynthesis
MTQLTCQHSTSVHQLHAVAAAWDNLWWRSEAALPTARAELLVQWLKQFHAQGDFHALVVVDEGQWVAALPLVSCRVGRLIPAGGLPTNPWSTCGELLLDPMANVDAVMDVLLASAGKLSWPLLWLNEVLPDTPRWKALLGACDRAGVAACCHERFRAGRVRIDGTWDSYRKRLAKSHRQGMQRALRRLEGIGEVKFEMCSRLAVDEMEPWLLEAFMLEDRSWKGSAGTSVLHTPGMFQFFVRQSKQLASWGLLEAAALRLDGRLLAFVSGYRAKGVYFAHKISYDPDFSAFSPGQLLFYHILERLHEEGEVHTLDFMGPMTQAMLRWRPETYGVGRIALAPQGGIGRALMYAYQHGWRALKERIANASQHEGDKTLEPNNSPVGEPLGAW